MQPLNANAIARGPFQSCIMCKANHEGKAGEQHADWIR